MDRRHFLQSAFLGCSLAASPLVTPVTFAATPGDHRLVVIILRGGMDGLDVVIPFGDPSYQTWRGHTPLGVEGAVDLDGFYAMHPGLRPLLPLWQAGDLGFVHAVSTPYRNKRSHFDGQDILEAGIPDLTHGVGRDGWLNRLLSLLPGASAETAYAVGRDSLSILSGDAPVSRWAPESDLILSAQALRLTKLIMAEDPAMAQALDKAFDLAARDGDPIVFEGSTEDMAAMMMQGANQASRRRGAETRLASFAAQRLSEEARIASFSISGWDSHARQDRVLNNGLNRLSQAILALQSALGPHLWDKTTLLAMTEFGRTVRYNGTGGTDHGTGGAMLLAGGAITGGRVTANWPGLTESDLLDRRDLMPTNDIRAHAGWIVRALFGVRASDVETSVFPGLDLGQDPGHLL
jgi:uncharacterized protein (DUF1501 family)